MSSVPKASVEKLCRVCREPDAKVVAKEMCARCYQRDYKGLPEEAVRRRSPRGEGSLIQVRAPQSMKDLVEHLAQLEGLTASEWIRKAIDDRAERQLAAIAEPKSARD